MRTKADIKSAQPRPTARNQTKKVEKRKWKTDNAQKYRQAVRVIHVVSPEEEKEGYGGKGSHLKRGFKPGMKQ